MQGEAGPGKSLIRAGNLSKNPKGGFFSATWLIANMSPDENACTLFL